MTVLKPASRTRSTLLERLSLKVRMMRATLGLLFISCFAAACETAAYDPYAGSGVLQEEKGRYLELVSAQANVLDTDLETSIGCVVDLSSVSGALASEDDAVGSSVYSALTDIYRERVSSLTSEGAPLPAGVAVWYLEDDFQAFDAYFKARKLSLEADGSSISDSAELCRTRIVDEMSEDDFTALALNAAIMAD